MSVFLTIILLVAVFIGGYYLAIHIIKIWTGCDNNEATTKLHNFVNGKAQYKLYNDSTFSNEIWNNVRNIIGEKRFNQLVNLSNTMIGAPLLYFNDSVKIPSINVSLYFVDENEKQTLENILVNIVKKYLRMYGYSTDVFVQWLIRYDLNMPYIQINYARTAEEKEALRVCLHSYQKSILEQNSDLQDDTEDGVLNG